MMEYYAIVNQTFIFDIFLETTRCRPIFFGLVSMVIFFQISFMIFNQKKNKLIFLEKLFLFMERKIH